MTVAMAKRSEQVGEEGLVRSLDARALLLTTATTPPTSKIDPLTNGLPPVGFVLSTEEQSHTVAVMEGRIIRSTHLQVMKNEVSAMALYIWKDRQCLCPGLQRNFCHNFIYPQESQIC